MKKILLIEDNTELRENTAEILELANYKVFTAENGKKGVDIAIAELPDLIICDIMMPVLDGYGVLHLLSNNEATKGIPFIFLTAKTEKSDFRKGMEEGADDFITKPFDDIELLKAIETRFKKSELLRSVFSRDSKGLGEFIDMADEHLGLQLNPEIRDVHKFRKKQIIYSEGSRPHYVYYITKGKIKTYMLNEDGKEFISGIFGPEDFVGYTAILEDMQYKENAETLEESELMMIPREDFEMLMHKDPEVTKQFVGMLTKNVLEQEEKLLSLAYNTLRKRVASALMDLYDKFKSEKVPDPVIDISRENLAHVVGTAKESLIRTLSDFKEEKLVDIREGKIHILNDKKLRNLPY